MRREQTASFSRSCSEIVAIKCSCSWIDLLCGELYRKILLSLSAWLGYDEPFTRRRGVCVDTLWLYMTMHAEMIWSFMTMLCSCVFYICGTSLLSIKIMFYVNVVKIDEYTIQLWRALLTTHITTHVTAHTYTITTLTSHTHTNHYTCIMIDEYTV